jgi:hypothetical protein
MKYLIIFLLLVFTFSCKEDEVINTIPNITIIFQADTVVYLLKIQEPSDSFPSSRFTEVINYSSNIQSEINLYSIDGYDLWMNIEGITTDKTGNIEAKSVIFTFTYDGVEYNYPYSTNESDFIQIDKLLLGDILFNHKDDIRDREISHIKIEKLKGSFGLEIVCHTCIGDSARIWIEGSISI